MNISQILNGHYWGSFETVNGKRIYQPNSPSGILGLIGLDTEDFDDRVSRLLEYYETPGLFPTLWSRLSEWEKEMLSLQIWADGNAKPADYAVIAAKYGVEKGKYSYQGDTRAYVSYDSPYWILCPCGEVASETRREIIKIIGERMPLKYEKYSPEKTDIMIGRETRMSDFATLVRFANGNKMTATKNGMLSKPSTRDFFKMVDYDEVQYYIDLKDASTDSIFFMRITSKIYLLSIIGGLLSF